MSRERNPQLIDRQELVGPPALLIRLPLEQPGQISALRVWLRRADQSRLLPVILERFLDDLDTYDAAA